MNKLKEIINRHKECPFFRTNEYYSELFQEAKRLREKLDEVKEEIWGDDYNEYSDDNLSSVIESIANR
jgi:hypothetical protein